VGGGGERLEERKKVLLFVSQDLSLRKPKPNQTKNKQTNNQTDFAPRSLFGSQSASLDGSITEPIASRSLYVILPFRYTKSRYVGSLPSLKPPFFYNLKKKFKITPS